MEQKNIKENTEMGEVISTTEAFLEKNKKVLTIAIIAVVVVVLAFFGLMKLSASRSEKANNMIFAAEQYFEQGQYELALNGNAEHAGLLEVADKYGCTKAGRRAKYEAALCYIYNNQMDEGLAMLKGYKGKDQLTPLFAELNMGNAEMELGNADKAVKHYTKVVNEAEGYEEIYTYATFLNGMAYLKAGNVEKANAMFNELKKYPQSAEYRLADQYIGLTDKAE